MKATFFLFFIVCLRKINCQNADCDALENQLNGIDDARAEAKLDCENTLETETSELESSQEFSAKRDDLQLDVDALSESLKCDDNEELKAYFDCHTSRGNANKASVSSLNSKSSKGKKEYEKASKEIERKSTKCLNTASNINEKERKKLQAQLDACEQD